jgi:predicted transcriptional regulator with HTH domain
MEEYFINNENHSLMRVVDGMLSESKEPISLGLIRPLVIRSLRRSNIRKKIAEYLFDISPSCSYTSEIAYHVKTTPTNVIGAIRGMGTRYKVEESLLNLNIVEEKSSKKNFRLYGITSFGKEVVENMGTPK